ncbi:hypothetical protein DVH05_022706 [Phytophthora capsici]|nr:hypothetical protein DVH05_022706 [Phytophthora capsici]
MKLVPNNLSCLYLVETIMQKDEKNVFKLGRSKNMKRFYKHSFEIGKDAKLACAQT